MEDIIFGPHGAQAVGGCFLAVVLVLAIVMYPGDAELERQQVMRTGPWDKK